MKRKSAIPVQIRNKSRMIGVVNVIISVLIWVIAAVYLFMFHGDMISDADYVRRIFVMAFALCVLCQVVINIIAVLIVGVKNV